MVGPSFRGEDVRATRIDFGNLFFCPHGHDSCKELSMKLSAWWSRMALATTQSRTIRRNPRHSGARRLAIEHMEERAMMSATQDFVYIGDQGNPNDAQDDTVDRFDATTGAYVDTFVAPNSGGLNGPRGLIFRNPGALLVVNQNVDLDSVNGEVLRYNGRTGAFLRDTVSADDPDAPFAPRGMVLRDNTLFVANVRLDANADQGSIERYDVNNGNYLGRLTPTNYPGGQFNPRGVVFGPDGQLYVGAFNFNNPLEGYIVRFDTSTGASSIVAGNDGDGVQEPGEINDLHRPEGLVFGPDGRLYVTSFRADANDNDRILVVDVASGGQVDAINLDQPGQARAFAQAIAFGPGGKLYVPITGNGPDTGSLRTYDVATKTFQVLIPPAQQGGLDDSLVPDVRPDEPRHTGLQHKIRCRDQPGNDGCERYPRRRHRETRSSRRGICPVAGCSGAGTHRRRRRQRCFLAASRSGWIWVYTRFPPNAVRGTG